jgi:hypothetical protein
MQNSKKNFTFFLLAYKSLGLLSNKNLNFFVSKKTNESLFVLLHEVTSGNFNGQNKKKHILV